MSSRIIFGTDEWIDDDDFKLFLKFSKYLGRENGVSRFMVDFNRLSESIRNGSLSPSEVIDLVEGYGVEFEEGSIDDLKKFLEEYMPRVIVRKVSNDIVLIPKVFLGDSIRDFREKGILIYDKGNKWFKLAKPMYFFDVLDSLKKRNIAISSEIDIKERIESPFRISFKGDLRDYQQEALESWRKNGYRGIIALPTGTGKTVIAIAAIAELSEKTLIVTFTKEQMFHWAEKIVSFTDVSKSMIGYYYSSEKRIAPITLTTYQSAFRYISSLSPYFSFLIIDEVHHLPADKFRYIAENMFARKRLGLSATVVREDGRHVDLFPLMGGIVYSKSVSELAEKGYIAPFTIKTIRVSLTKEEKEKYRKLLEKYKKLSRGREFQTLLEDAKRGDVTALEAIKTRAELRNLVHSAKEKIEALKAIVGREIENSSKIIVFTQYIEQAENLAEILNTIYITGELDEDTRKRRLEMFKNNMVKILVLTTVGDEGIDIPDANVGIIFAGTGSRRQFIQRLGRLLRPLPGKEARLYEIIVKGTFEEVESRKRRKALEQLFEDISIIDEDQ